MNNNLALYFALAMASILMLIFAVSFTWQLTHPDYEIPAGLYPLLTVTVGGIIGYVFKRGSANGS